MGWRRTSPWDDQRIALCEVFWLADEHDDEPLFLERDFLQHHLMLGEGALQGWGCVTVSDVSSFKVYVERNAPKIPIVTFSFVMAFCCISRVRMVVVANGNLWYTTMSGCGGKNVVCETYRMRGQQAFSTRTPVVRFRNLYAEPKQINIFSSSGSCEERVSSLDLFVVVTAVPILPVGRYGRHSNPDPNSDC